MNQRPLLPFLARLGGGLLLGALVVLSVVPRADTRIFTWPWAFYAQSLLIAPLFLAALLHLRPRRPRLSGGTPLVLCAFSLGLSVLMSRNPQFSFECALLPASALAFVWWLAHAFHSRFDRAGQSLPPLASQLGLVLLAPLLSSVGLWLADIIPPLLAASGLDEVAAILSNARNPHPFGHWNETGAFGLLVLPWFAALAVLARGWRRRGWSLAALLALLLVFSSGSRGAALGLLALAGAVFSLALAGNRINRRRALCGLAATLALVTLLVLTNARLRGYVLDPSSILQPNAGDVQRLAMTRGGWLLGLERPWIGHGPGMVPFVYPEVRAQLVGGVETSYQLHNAWLHLWVTTGLLGLLCLASLAFALGAATRRWLRSPDSPARTLALAGAAALVGYAVFAVTDYQLDVIAIVAAIALHAAVVLSGPAAAAEASRIPGKLAGGLFLLAALAASGLLLPSWRARQIHWSAWAGNPGESRLALLARAAEAAPRNPHYQNQFAFQLALAAAGPAERAAARTAFARSLALDRSQEPVHAALGWLWLPDEPREAAASFGRALALLPDRPTLHLGLAYALLALGQTDAATHSLAVECLVAPRFLASPLWANPALHALRPAVLARLDTLYAQSLAHPALPRWRKADLTYARAFSRWWAGGPAPSREELGAATSVQRGFFAALATAPSHWPEPWAALAGALAEPSRANERLQSPSLQLTDAARTGAVARLAASPPPANLPDLLRSPAPGNTGIVGTRFERIHYSIMHRNLDGEGYADLNPRFSDAFTLRFAGSLFPQPELIPGPVLHDLRP